LIFSSNITTLTCTKVLKKVANSLRNTLKRKDDYYFRLGGEEFAIIFKSKTLENAIQFSQSLKNSIENLNIEHKNSKISDKITISLGLVCKASKEVKSFEDIYKEADLLLYKAKNSGRNKVVSNL
jgi:diguanylate cyclase (GGDEF)-like protein